MLDGTELKSASVAGRLKGKRSAFLYVMTVGLEIDECEEANYHFSATSSGRKLLIFP
jgi:hypothetical protein